MDKRVFAAISLALLLFVPAAIAQSSSCSSVTPANTAFTAALIGSGISGTGLQSGFANVNFALNGNQATVTANSLGLGSNITSIALFQGQPGTGTARLIQTFSSPSNGFNNGRFSATMALDQNTINQIQANPSAFFFVVTTPSLPQGAVAGALAPSRQQLIGGTLNGSSLSNGSTIGAGSFLFTIGPSNGSAFVPLYFDISTNGIGNDFNSLVLTAAGSSTPIITFGNNISAVNGRLTGTVLISPTFAARLPAR